jgi:DNA-binding transcriptional ArsR family regulator
MENGKAEMFKVLGVETRIKIIELLKQKGPLGVKEMADVLGVTPSAVSQHLKVLRSAGLVRNERKGYWIPYRIDQAALEQCGQLLSSVCTCGCGGSGDLRAEEFGQVEDRIELLRRQEKELERQLSEVRNRIRELE